MNHMEYKGYTAVIEYDNDDDCFVGRVIGITDRIAFDGESTAELRRHFHEVLDTYLTHCDEVGRAPETPKSGKMLLRLPAELHAYVSKQSEVTGESVNNIVVKAIQSLRSRDRRAATRKPDKTVVKNRRKTREPAGTGK